MLDEIRSKIPFLKRGPARVTSALVGFDKAVNNLHKAMAEIDDEVKAKEAKMAELEAKKAALQTAHARASRAQAKLKEITL